MAPGTNILSTVPLDSGTYFPASDSRPLAFDTFDAGTASSEVKAREAKVYLDAEGVGAADSTVAYGFLDDLAKGSLDALRRPAFAKSPSYVPSWQA